MSPSPLPPSFLKVWPCPFNLAGVRSRTDFPIGEIRIALKILHSYHASGHLYCNGIAAIGDPGDANKYWHARKRKWMQPELSNTASGTAKTYVVGDKCKITPRLVIVIFSRSTPLNASAFSVTLDSSVKSRPAHQTKSTSPGRLQFGVTICYNKIKR